MAIYNIRGYHGGVGDQIQFSTLPQLLVEQGHTVNLYTGPDVLPFRNPEIKDLWARNPYISGESKTDWNCGDIPGLPYKNTTGSFIKNWEVAFGLPPTNDLPIIYHTPTKIPAIYGVIELSAQTLRYRKDDVEDAVYSIMRHADIPFVQLVNPHQANPIILPNVQQMPLNGIFHAFDIFASCQCLITLNSGLHSVGAAVRRVHDFTQHCLIPNRDWHWIMSDKKFIFDGIKYHPV